MSEDKLNNIFKKILGSGAFEKNVTIDSVTYVELLITIQNELKIKFTTQEFLALRDVESIKTAVLKKLV